MTVTENGDKAEITITVLPGRGGDPLANVNRWRGQIKLPEIDDVELFKSLTRIETQGLPAAMVTMIGKMPWLTPKAIFEAGPMPKYRMNSGRMVICGMP